MNLQICMRAAMCAALVVVCLVGAECRPIQMANNSQQTQQIYKPGLRNSFDEHALNATELNLVLNQLQKKTGFVRMRFDNDGFLRVDDRQDFVGGSARARELVLAAIDGKKVVVLQSHNRSPEVGFARRGYETRSVHWQADLKITSTPIEIDFDDFKHLRGHTEAIAAFDLGFVILHELCHAVLGLSDVSDELNPAGGCENYVNQIRRELGMPERQHYLADVTFKKMFSSAPSVETATLRFAKTKPGRRPDRRAKKKTLFLRWEVPAVGGKSDNTALPKMKPKLESDVAMRQLMLQIASQEK